MIRRALLALPFLLALTAGFAHAQYRVGLEVNGGAAFPMEDLGTMALNTGAGAGLTATLQVLPHTHLYAGWEFYRFTPEDDAAAERVMDTGYAFGAKFQHPLLRNIEGWVRAGGVYNHVEVENDEEELADTGHELGWEAGGGLSIPLTSRFALMPGVRYRTYTGTLGNGGDGVAVEMSYLVGELRLSWTLGQAAPATAAR